MQRGFSFRPPQYLIRLTIVAWLSMIGLDFILHAGVLAELYLQPGPFLLSPAAALALIPAGYLALLLLAALAVWLMHRVHVAGWREGAIFGLQLGGLTSGAFALGLLSISTASFPLLVGWFIGQTLELVLAGAVVGSGLSGIQLRRLFGRVLVFVLLSVVTTIILQSLGIVPTTRI